MENSYYFLPADIKIIPIGERGFLFRSDSVSVRFEGESSKFVAERVIPLLNGTKAIGEIASMLTVDAQDLQNNLDKLVSGGVLRKRNQPIDSNSNPSESVVSKIAEGFGVKEFARIIEKTHILVAGLEGPGTLLVCSLLASGFREITLVDPFPCTAEDVLLNPLVFTRNQIGFPRQKMLKNFLEAKFTEAIIHTGPDTLDREIFMGLSEGVSLIAACFDKDFIAAHYWINAIALQKKIPVIYSEINGYVCRTGPLVIPEQTACFMCYRMRSIATEKEFEEAMAYEEFLNKLKNPALFNKQFLPSSVYYCSSMLLNEILKYFLAPALPSLSGRVLEFNSLDLNTESSVVQKRHDCPVCKKKEEQRMYLNSGEFDKAFLAKGDIYFSRKVLIDSRCGIINRFERFKKDMSEPAIPFIYRADIANHLFESTKETGNNICSGKGLSVQDAEISALGESVERYSASLYNKKEIRYTTFTELEGNKLDPADLVLYHPDQYTSGIEFNPYHHGASIGWVKAYSLKNDSFIHVPASAVFMNYKINTPDEYIFQITSNGLAAGPDLISAIISGALELIERDAFIIGWHNRLPFQRINPMNHPDTALTDYCRLYARRGVDLQLYKLVTDFPCFVFMAVGVQTNGSDGPYAVVGLGSDFDPSRAAKGALLEVGQVRPALKQRMRIPEVRQRMLELVANPSLVEDLNDHDLLYAHPSMATTLDFLTERPIQQFEWTYHPQSKIEKLHLLIDFTKNSSMDLIYFNLTAPELWDLGLYTVRVLIPGTQPIHFGYKNIRMGGNRMFDLPVKLGHNKKVISYKELNMIPHPLA